MSVFRMVLATSNPHKVVEFGSLLPQHFQLTGLKEVGILEEIPETGSTFGENALQKARYVNVRTSLPVIADDSGLEVFALGGAPGVFSARYAGPQADSAANVDKLLGAMSEIIDRSARFVCVIALIMNGKEYLFEGVCEGRLTNMEMGLGGFGYDPVFIPDGYESTFSQMDPVLKNEISHRGKAVQKLLNFLNSTERH